MNSVHRSTVRLVPSKGPVRIGVYLHSLEEGNKPSSRYVAFSSYLNLQKIYNVQASVLSSLILTT
jgi:hypothetical protein